VEQIIHTDIFIAGAGASGIAAAVAAAELGLNVCIAEKNSFVGGRATASAVGTVCGLYYRSHDATPKFVMKGFPKQFGEQLIKVNGKAAQKFSEGLWFIPALPQSFETTALLFLKDEKINLIYNTTVTNVESLNNQVKSVTCICADKEIKIFASAFIDCSGEGVLCTSINHSLIKDTEYQAAAIVFAVENIDVVDEFSLSYTIIKQIMKHIESGIVAEYYNLLSIVPNSIMENSVLLKMGLPWKVGADYFETSNLETKAQQLVKELASFLKYNVIGFKNSNIKWIAKEVGVRTGIRAKVKRILADADVLNCVKYDDSICNGAWPIEYWKTGNKKVEMTWFAENDFYTIPADCLMSGEKENFFFAGKIISAEEKAIASARVIGTCLGTGYSAGVLAAYKVKNINQLDAIDFIMEKMLKH